MTFFMCYDLHIMHVIKLLIVTSLIVLLLAVSSTPASAHDDEERFCIVPVMGGVRGDGWAEETRRLTSNAFLIPGLPGPVFTSNKFNKQLMITADRNLVPYTARFPENFLEAEKWVQEPWSGRIVAASYAGGISTLAPGSEHFEEIGHEVAQVRPYYHGASALPRRRLTVVVGPKGVPFVVGENTIKPWLSLDELAAHGVHGVSQLLDSPFLSATLILDENDVLHALTDTDEWYELGWVKKRDYRARIVDAPVSGVALISTTDSLVTVRPNSSHSGHPFDFETLATTRSDVDSFYISGVFARALAYHQPYLFNPWYRWQQLTPQGLVDIPGGDLSLPKVFHNGREYIHDLLAFGRTLIEGDKGLYIYDGTKIEPVLGGQRERLGDYYRIRDLPSIGRVLVTTQSGILELTRDGRLIDRPMPFPAEGTYPGLQIVDWPNAGVALVSTKAGLFILDRDLTATPIVGGDMIDLLPLGFSIGEMPSTGEMIVTSSRGIFLAVDTQRAGKAACQQERQLRQAIRDSDLCLKPLPITDKTSVGLAIGDVAEPLKDGRLLIDTAAGAISLQANGVLTGIQPRDGQYTQDLAKLPWSDEIVIMERDNTDIWSGHVIEYLARHRFAQLLGILPSIQSVLVTSHENGPVSLFAFKDGKYQSIATKLQSNFAAVDAPWFEGPVLGTQSSIFSMDRNGVLTPFIVSYAKGLWTPDVNGFDEPVTARSDFFAIDRFQTIYVLQRPNGWFRITRDRKWLPINELPSEVALAHFDPGRGDALFGTLSGIFAVSAAGDARKLAGDPGPSQAIRAFASIGESIIAGGNEGLFEVQPDLSTVMLVENGGVASIGSVLSIAKVGFADLCIIETSKGVYAFEAGKLSRIRDLAVASGESYPLVSPNIHRVLVKNRLESGPSLSELARRDDDAQCTKPINATN